MLFEILFIKDNFDILVKIRKNVRRYVMGLHDLHPHIRWTPKKMALSLVFTTIIMIATLLVTKKTPNGYIHMGNAFVLLVSLYFGPELSIVPVALGSCLADLALRMPEWALYTLFIKGTMAFIMCAISRRRPRLKLAATTTFAGAVVGSAYCVLMYTLASCIMAGSFSKWYIEAKWLLFEAVVGVILFYIFGFIIDKTKVYKMLYS